MLGDNQIKQNAVAIVMVKPGAGAGGQRVGAVRSGARADGGEKAGVRPAEAGRAGEHAHINFHLSPNNKCRDYRMNFCES